MFLSPIKLFCGQSGNNKITSDVFPFIKLAGMNGKHCRQCLFFAAGYRWCLPAGLLTAAVPLQMK
jgi:hypothetical protein